MEGTYIIGEIGQNHNGSVDIAKLIIDLASRTPKDELFGTSLKKMDAIKLTMRDLDYELSESQMNRPYDSPHSFGKTYGAHRAFLELSFEEHLAIHNYAKSKGLDVVETLCAPGCLNILNFFAPDYLKVASRDLTNLPLLERMAEARIPMILSTGMGGEKEIDQALEVITKEHNQISILHCLSQYPAEHGNINLLSITRLLERYPEFTIGYSDHSVGIMVPVAAVALGAKMIEKHITIDRDMKGTDQKGSLGPDGVIRMVRDIRILEQAMGEKEIKIDTSVSAAREKLERSIAANKRLEKGHKISEADIILLSPGDGFKWHERSQVIGKVVNEPIPAKEIIYSKHIEPLK
jgi:sialic acid synthase